MIKVIKFVYGLVIAIILLTIIYLPLLVITFKSKESWDVVDNMVHKLLDFMEID